MTQPATPPSTEVPWPNHSAHPPLGNSSEDDAVVVDIPAPDGETEEKPEPQPEEQVVETPSMILRLNPSVVRVLRDAFTKVGDGVPVTIVME